MSHNTVLPPPGSLLREDIVLHHCFKLAVNFQLTSEYVLPTDYVPPPGFGYPPGTYLKAGTRLPAGSALLSGAVLPVGYVLPRGSIMPNGAFLSNDHAECQQARLANEGTLDAGGNPSAASTPTGKTESRKACGDKEVVCDFCDKSGLPIMPVRYAVAPVSAHAPIATGNITPTDGEGNPISIGNYAHYTLRVLRSGYLYVFDEARKRWDGYYVNATGYFMKFDIGDGLSLAATKGREPCHRDGHREIASCITISSPKQATNVWIAFSDTEWTARVRKLHEDNISFRERHMQKIDVKAALKGLPSSLPARPIGELGNIVAEYNKDTAANWKALEFSPFAWSNRDSSTSTTIGICECLYPQRGLIVAVNDPAGIATEVCALMHEESEAFLRSTKYKHELFTYAHIRQLEQAVREEAIDRNIQAGEMLAAEEESGFDYSTGIPTPDVGTLFPWYRKQREENAKKLREITPEESQRVADDAWKRYKSCYNFDEAEQWKKDYDVIAQEFDKTHILPLAVAYVAWMKSKIIESYFACNFDDESPQSGLAYAKTVSMCLGDAQDKLPCFELFVEWLGGSVTDKSNLVLRALVLNIEKTAQEIETALSSKIHWSTFQPDAIIGAFGQATEEVANGKADVIGRGIIVPLLGPISKIIGDSFDNQVRPVLVTLGLYTNKTFTSVEVTGRKKVFRAALIRELRRATGQHSTDRKMEKAVADELRRLKATGTALDGSTKKSFLLMVDPDKLVDLPEGLSKKEQAHWMAKAITTPEDVEALRLSDWRERVRNPTSAVLKGSIPYITGLVAAVIQYNIMQKLIEDDSKAMGHQKKEATHRMYAGVAALASTIADLAGKGAQKLTTKIPKLAKAFSTLGRFSEKVIARGAGVAAAIVVGTWDVINSIGSFRRGHFLLGSLQMASGAVAATTAWWILMGTLSVAGGFLLIAVAIAIALAIEYLKDNKFQEWLKHCIWGIEPPRYQTFSEAHRELELALEN